MHWCFIKICTYTREDIQILQTIGQYETYLHCHPDSRSMVTVKLDKAEQHDKIIFLIKTYNNIPSTWNAKVIYPLLRSQRVVNPYYNLIEMSLCADESCELWLTSTMPKNHLLCILRDPLLLQLIGVSRATATIPFQIFHLLGSLLQPYWTWVHCFIVICLYFNQYKGLSELYPFLWYILCGMQDICACGWTQCLYSSVQNVTKHRGWSPSPMSVNLVIEEVGIDFPVYMHTKSICFWCSIEW